MGSEDKEIIQVSIRFPIELKAKLEKMAKRRYASFNSVVIWAIAEFFSREESIQGGQEDPGAEGAGESSVKPGPIPPKVSGRSGEKDQGKKHDQRSRRSA
jgi:hypothetical protein